MRDIDPPGSTEACIDDMERGLLDQAKQIRELQAEVERLRKLESAINSLGNFRFVSDKPTPVRLTIYGGYAQSASEAILEVTEASGENT